VRWGFLERETKWVGDKVNYIQIQGGRDSPALKISIAMLKK